MGHFPPALVSIDNINASSDDWSAGKFLSHEQTTSITTATTTAITANTTITTPKEPVPTAATATISAASKSSFGTLTAVQSESRTTCISPEPQRGQDADQDTIWQVLVNLDRLVLDARNNHLLLAAEIEDLMCTLEDHCRQLGLDASNVSHLLILPFTAPITLTTRQALHRACDDLYQDILRRKERIERWVSRIITIAENIREPPEPFLETNMPPMSRARILQLERTYRTLEMEWMSRLQRFQSMVGMLRVRWDQCAYFPVDDYDHALNRLFELFELDELHDQAAGFSYLRIEAPLCLSRKCLASLSAKLADLDQNFYTRQSRIRAMEHVLGLIYQDLRTPVDKRVAFRNETTVKYAAEVPNNLIVNEAGFYFPSTLGRELKALQLELTARKFYQAGELWNALVTVWDTCLVTKPEREQFKSAIEQDDVTFSEKLERIQTEMETCRVRFSKSSVVYKLMMTRSNHIERMKNFEHSASDPKRLFQSSFQLVEEEKFRRRAYPTLLKFERTLIEAIESFEREHGEHFMYEGVPYLETLQAEIEKRHVNETVFAKFTPVIAAPTRSQTIQIMGRPASPISTPPLSTPVSRPSQSSRNLLSSTRSLESSRRSTVQATAATPLPSSPPSHGTNAGRSKDHQKFNSQEGDINSNDVMQSLKPYLLSHQRDTSAASTTSLGSSHSLKSKISNSSLSMTSTSASVSASASNSPLTEIANNTNSYFTSFTSTTSPSTPSALSPSSSSSSLSSLISLAQSLPIPPKQDMKSHQQERHSLSSNIKSSPGMPGQSTGLKSSIARSQTSPGRRVGN
ncbi:carboxypeptidase C prc1 [Mortierella sp. AM989]|nr:carboxypeptidase C prc1 [Mortierella sp. AM989]